MPSVGQNVNNQAPSDSSANGVSSSSEQDDWSAVQERALVQALKTFPKETNQRWERSCCRRSWEDGEPVQEKIHINEGEL